MTETNATGEEVISNTEEVKRFQELEEALSFILRKSHLPEGCRYFVVKLDDEEKEMSEYKDISSKIEDVKNALDSLYESVHSQYDGIFKGEDVVKCQRMIQDIISADKCMNEANSLNNELLSVLKRA